jgi:putative hemolysin
VLIAELAVVVALIVVNGFLAMSELALVSARRPLLEQMARQGSGGAIVALQLVRNPGRLLSAVQIGITLVGIIAGAYSGATIAERVDAWLERQGVPTPIAEPAAYVVVVATITYFSVVVGELIPKQVGLLNAERVAVIVARPMQVLAIAAAPAVALLDRSARLGLRLLGQSTERDRSVTDEEIRTLIKEAESTGLVEPEERTMISRVMRFADRSVRAIMTPRPDIDWLDLNAGEEQARKALQRATHGRLLVGNGSIDEIVGAIRVRLALASLLDNDLNAMWGLVEKVPVVTDRLAAIDVIGQLRQSPLNLVMVVDEHGSIEGIVTEGDVLKAIVTDIAEEKSPSIQARDDGSLLIDGSFQVDELAERLAIVLPADHEFQTVAGFALAELQHLPKPGDSFSYGAWRFEIVDMDGQRVDKLLATPRRTLHRGA